MANAGKTNGAPGADSAGAVRAAPAYDSQGLCAAEVAERVARGATNVVARRTSRTVGEILRANVFTVFNALLASLFVVTLATGQWQNGLFGIVVVVNSAIGVTQELRAKRTLDRLALLHAAQVRVVRDGEVCEIAREDVVVDDLVVLGAGDQVPADGRVVASDGLEVDESMLTGESAAVAKTAGEELRSGSIVVAGAGRAHATAVGRDSYAARLAEEARRFTLTRSELLSGINRVLRGISVIILVVGPVLLWSQFNSPDNHGWQDAVTGTVAALVGMIPEGLVLLTTLAFLIGTLTLARRGTLVQELPAVEGLARVDVVCLDKTGTLTYGDPAFDRLVPLAPREVSEDDAGQALALLAAAAGTNPTAAALRTAFPKSSWQQTAAVPFSSARKWSAVTAAGQGSWVLGAPELVAAAADAATRRAADDLAASGQRVLLLARAPEGSEVRADLPLPDGLRAATLVVLAERIREDAARTLRYFTEQGVRVKIVSGDNPHTVGAVAGKVGVPGVENADDALDARQLPEEGATFDEVVGTTDAFGRVTPYQKRAIVGALQRHGHVVAMTGDGVNDALALKDADIGVAMGSGSAASRAVAQLVLLDGRFAHLPDVVAEGRRVIANIERAANLFIVKNVYALQLALIVAVTRAAYPLAPIQLTLISALTIGIPGFVLALAPNTRRYVPGFLSRVLRFSIPAGVIIGSAAYLGYYAIRLLDRAGGVDGARTTATFTVLIASLWTLGILARPITGWKIALLAGLAGLAAVITLVPAIGTGIVLLQPTPERFAVAVVVGAAAAVLIEITHAVVIRFVPAGPRGAQG
ncbi:MAG TPA: HAD-IC family P-type ATPase [Jatrophihabitans sp.]|nr:HAD-IC family P-type ATPase [Jatrophihabitans sp.]